MSLTSIKTSIFESPYNPFYDNYILINNGDSYCGKYITEALKKLEPLKVESEVESVYGEMENFMTQEPPRPATPYEIITTASDVSALPHGVKLATREKFIELLPFSSIVVINITETGDALELANEYIARVDALLEQNIKQENTDQNRFFILLSTVMTWAETKPTEAEEYDSPLVEGNFRKRRCQINYRELYNIENDVMKLARKYKGKLNALVLVSGITYGEEEDLLKYWFESTWDGALTQPVIGKGNNIIPLIYVHDLAAIIAFLLQNFPQKLYLLAVEPSTFTQKDIVRALSEVLGYGIYKSMPQESFELADQIDQRTLEAMTVNLSMQPDYVANNVAVSFSPYWSIDVFGDKIPTLFKEFQAAKKIQTYRIVVHGPPAVGKTTLCKQLCEKYDLVYISPEIIFESTKNELLMKLKEYEELAEKPLQMGEEHKDLISENDDTEWDTFITEAKNQIAYIESGALNEEDIVTYIKQLTLTNKCTNKGWVLDGYPDTVMNCELLFEGTDMMDEPEPDPEAKSLFEEDIELYNRFPKTLLPTHVVTLIASNEYIERKISIIPERDRKNTKLEEEVLMERLYEFRKMNTIENTPLNFFDELDIHPIVLNAEKDDYELTACFQHMCSVLGTPNMIGKLLERFKEREQSELNANERLKSMQEGERNEVIKALQRDREDKMQQWLQLREKIHDEEKQIISAEKDHLRDYLVKYIFPTLDVALQEISKVRPDDPIDYLAEFLFQRNPNGKLTDPGDNPQSQILLKEMDEYKKQLTEMGVKMTPCCHSGYFVPGPASTITQSYDPVSGSQ